MNPSIQQTQKTTALAKPSRIYSNIATTLPGDKSITHRTFMLSALATGESRISGALLAGDCLSTLKALQALNIPCRSEQNDIVISGVGIAGLSSTPENTTPVLDLGNSGTGIRLMAGLLIALGASAKLIGDQSLSKRPMARVVEPLRRLGFDISCAANGCLPIEVVANPSDLSIDGFNYISPVASAQLKSAILLAGLRCQSPVTVHESVQSREHTELMLTAMGCDVTAITNADGHTVQLQPPSSLQPQHWVVPGDPSASAFAAVATVLSRAQGVRLRNICALESRIGFVEVLKRMGVDCVQENPQTLSNHAVSDIVVSSPERLKPIELTEVDIPSIVDELPVLSLVMAVADGKSTVRGAGELRHKESDRIATTVAMLRQLGVDVVEYEDGFEVNGSVDQPFESCDISTHGDHRLAMSAAVASCNLGSNTAASICIDHWDMTETSFPNFAPLFNSFGCDIVLS